MGQPQIGHNIGFNTPNQPPINMANKEAAAHGQRMEWVGAVKGRSEPAQNGLEVADTQHVAPTELGPARRLGLQFQIGHSIGFQAPISTRPV